jgi:questin oxidase-like protein
MNRRALLEGTATGLGAGVLGCAGGSKPQPTPAARSTSADDALDGALARLHQHDVEFSGGLSNHGPMAAEALDSLGHADRIEPFIAQYQARLAPMPAAEPLRAERWRDSLGRIEDRAALVATFAARLQRDEPEAVLADVAPLLAPGVVAAAFHGLLRTAHAFRAWQRRPSEARRAELAHGIGYWVARHQLLPGEPGKRAQRGLGPAEALARVPFVPPHLRRGGLILDRFDVLRDRGDFTEVVEAFDPDARTPDQALDEMASAAARLYLGTSSEGSRFVYLHGVTSTAALRSLLPALPPEAQRSLVAHQFAALAAVHATHGEVSDALTRLVRSPDLDPAAIGARASMSTDDHTIKLVEACLREHRRGGRPEFLAAAAHRAGLASG